MTFEVIIAETKTGKILNPDGTRHGHGTGEYRLPFPDEDAAIVFSREQIRLFPDRECIVLDPTGECLHVFRTAGRSALP